MCTIFLLVAVQVKFATNENNKTEIKSLPEIKTSGTTEQAIKTKCFEDLLEKCRNMASEKNVTLASVMHMEALKNMSLTLPLTDTEMLEIPHVTKANFEKYGKALLEITTKYACTHFHCVIL